MSATEELLEKLRTLKYDYDSMSTSLEDAIDDIAYELEQAIAATLGSGTCKPTEEGYCPICGEDLVKCNVGIGELGGAIELDQPIYHNYCPNCGRKVVDK